MIFPVCIKLENIFECCTRAVERTKTVYDWVLDSKWRKGSLGFEIMLIFLIFVNTF